MSSQKTKHTGGIMKKENNYNNLSSEFCGIQFPNPFILASAPPTDTKEKIMRAFELGWGGAVTKTLKPDHLKVKNVTPRFATIKDDKGAIIGFENFELVDTKQLDYWVDAIGEIKRTYPDRILIGSIMAEVNKEDWQALAQVISSAGADALELNFSCPHGMPEKGIGAAIGQNKEISQMITAWVKEVVNIPVIVKLTPNVTDVVSIAKGVEEAGADALAAINTVQSLIGVDIHSFEPKPTVDRHTTYGGFSGKAVKPIGLRVVSEVVKAVDLPMSGMGGISTWEDAVEYILLGADHVQICTEVMVKGCHIIEELNKGLSDYIALKGFDHVHEMVGLALPKITTHEALNRDYEMELSIDEHCVGCKKCTIVCRDSAKSALSMVNNHACVDHNKCDRCSLCTHVCPVGAMTLIKKKEA